MPFAFHYIVIKGL